LYEQLQNVWNRNNTEELKEDLEKKYNELRTIQSELKKSSKSIEMEFENELKKSLSREENLLKQKEKNLIEKKKTSKNFIKMKKENLTPTLEKYRREEQTIADSINKVGERKTDKFRREKEKIKEEKNGLPKLFEQKERDLESEFEELRNGTIEQIKNSNIKGTSEFSRRLKRIQGTYKNWN